MSIRKIAAYLLFLVLLFAFLSAQAQPRKNTLSLPDAPLPTATSQSSSQNEHPLWHEWLHGDSTAKVADPLEKYIQPNQQALPLTAKGKLALSGWEQLQPYAFGTQILAAGWEHLLDSDPQYGSDSAGFGERLGAATLRQGTQAILADGIFAAAFHQDPRYYRKGSGSLLNRAVYAATRVIVTRTDDGREAPNYAQMVGYFGASALTMTYYPAVSATWPRTIRGYGVSLAGSALGNVVHEFVPSAEYLWVHLLHRSPSDHASSTDAEK